MNNKNNVEDLRAQFAQECKLINLTYEYPSYDKNGNYIPYDGNEKWAIVTSLPSEELTSKYAEIIQLYSPFVLLTPSQADAIYTFKRNENKFRMRQLRGTDAFCFEDGITELYHSNLIIPDFTSAFSESTRVQIAISQLTPTQRKRLIKYFFYGYTEREIAEEENVSCSSIHESIQGTLKKLKKLLVKP